MADLSNRLLPSIQSQLLQKLDLSNEPLDTRKKILDAFSEYLVYKMINNLRNKKNAYFEDMGATTFGKLYDLYISLLGEEDFALLFKQALADFRRK